MILSLVTGGAGMIGSHVADALVDRGHSVIVIDNLSTGRINNINKHALFFEIDLTDRCALEDLFEAYRFEYVFHLGAQINLRTSITHPEIDANTNVIGTINLLKNCHSVDKFIFASTGGAIYTPDYTKIPWTEECINAPQSPYGLSKFCAEQYIQLLARQNNFEYIILRLSNVYGPRQNAHGEAGVISIFKEKMERSFPCTIFGDGTQTRDFVYVRDVVNAFMLSVNYDGSGIFNVATNTEIAINELTILMFRLLNMHPDIIYSDKIDGEMLRSCLSYNKIKNAMGWAPKYTLEDGLKQTLI